MDMKKEISFGGGKKKVVYPTKTHVNLVKAEVSKRTTALEVGLFVVFVVLLAIAAKFAVVDPLMSASASTSELSQAQKQLDELKTANADYSELTDKYARYVVAGMTEEELGLANRDEIIDLLKTKVMNATYLSSVKVSKNTITIVCAGVGLQDVSGLVQSLETDKRVSHVTVSTAQSKDNQGSSATIEVTLKSPTADAAADSASAMMEGATNGK